MFVFFVRGEMGGKKGNERREIEKEMRKEGRWTRGKGSNETESGKG